MNASLCTFLIKYRYEIDSIEFIDSSKEDNQVNEMVQLHIDRMINMAIDYKKEEIV